MSLYGVNVSGESLAAATTETLIQGVAGAKKIELVRWGVSFNGVTNTDAPVLVELIRLSSAGTSAAFVPVKLNPSDDAPLMTARTSHTAEPTNGDVLERHYVTPAGGNLVLQYAYDERVSVAAVGRLGIRVQASAIVSAAAFMIFDE
jgi:hypothetical protein